MPLNSQFVLGAGSDGQAVGQPLRLANRHGLIAGATGT
ncbi:helicase HerA-like domain-containing protein, partial [Pseudomonas sp. GW6]